MKKLISAIILVMALALTMGLCACDQEGSAEKAGKKVDQAVKDAGEKADKAMDQAKDAVKDASKQVDKATEQANQALKDAEKKAEESKK